jgi:hypothetical protein
MIGGRPDLAFRNEPSRHHLDRTRVAAAPLIFVFDLGVAQVTFDFASYLAEAERRARQLATIFVAIVPDG